jgi:hypothetical protein
MTLQLPASLVNVPPGHYASIHEVFVAMGIVIPLKSYVMHGKLCQSGKAIRAFSRKRDREP